MVPNLIPTQSWRVAWKFLLVLQVALLANGLLSDSSPVLFLGSASGALLATAFLVSAHWPRLVWPLVTLGATCSLLSLWQAAT